MDRCRFEIADCPSEDVARLRRELGVSDALAQVLVRRGYAAPEVARAFLAAEEEHSPQAFEGIEAAVDAILDAVARGELITIHGDYDVDGICSTAILVRALRELGAGVDFYLPDRADGYGLSAATVRRLAQRGTRLLVTADCAITAVEEVELARSLGMSVVVSDHHSPRADGLLPGAPIVHPAVSRYPCRDLCATAVAYKLAQATYEACGRDPVEIAQDLDLVALATVADVVPLLGENRTLLRRGLRALAATRKPGLRALMAVAGVPAGKVDERAIGFGLAPRLNAAGRLYRADAGLELLLTGDPGRAEQVARELDAANSERREVERRIRFEAEAQMAELGDRPAYVLSGESWHAGVIGIVASRLVEQSGRPVVMVALSGDRGKGSGRSIEAFDLLGGLSACSEHLLRFGGHRGAAGLELEREQLPAFDRALCEHATRVLESADPTEVERVDAVVRGEMLGMELAEELAALAPFGRANPKVSLMVADATFRDPRPMGEGRHVRFTVESSGFRAGAVAFGGGSRLPVAEGEPAQATFALEVNEWNGVCEPRLVLRRAQPAATPEPGFAPEPQRTSAPAEAMQSPQPELQPIAATAEARKEEQQEELVLFALP